MKSHALTIFLTLVSAADVAAQSDVNLKIGRLKPTLHVATTAPGGSVPLSESRESFAWPPTAKENRWVYLVIHHSATNGGSVESIHREHRRRRDAAGAAWLGIGYHFVIGNGDGMEDGAIEPTFRWRQQIHGAHSGSRVHNANGIGICLIGNFQVTQPTRRQQDALVKLIRQLATRYHIPRRLIIGHSQVKPTQCPGKQLRLDQLVQRAVGVPEKNKRASICPPGILF